MTNARNPDDAGVGIRTSRHREPVHGDVGQTTLA